VYLDIILLLNVAIDSLLLWFTAYFRKERVIWWRILAASLFGSTYLVFFFLPAFAALYQWFVKLLFSIIMLLIAFGYRRFRLFVQNLCMFYFVAFVFGGGVFALHFLFAERNQVVNGILVTHNDGFGVAARPTFLIVLIGFTLIYFLSRQSYQAIQEPRRIESFLTEVVVKLNGESIICRGLVDTGNQLYEPISRIPVMVIEASLLAHVLPERLLASAASPASALDQAGTLMEELPVEWQNRLRLVPYRSVSRGMDFLLAIKPDLVCLLQNGNRWETGRVLLGLNPIPLSADRKYQAIVHPALMQTAATDPVKTFEQEG